MNYLINDSVKVQEKPEPIPLKPSLTILQIQ